MAGGSGHRFGQLKQYAPLDGRPVLEWAVAACRRVSAGVVLVLPAGSATDHGPVGGADTVVPGGATRAESVGRGLAAVPAEADVVLVHDAARPLASPALFDAVLAALDGEGVDGVVPGLPVRDTIKQVDGEQKVIGTPERATLVAVQTPQGFRASVLRAAHDGGRPDATDDASLVEALGATVVVVPGEESNLKITTPDDLAAAERLVAGRIGGAGATASPVDTGES